MINDSVILSKETSHMPWEPYSQGKKTTGRGAREEDLDGRRHPTGNPFPGTFWNWRAEVIKQMDNFQHPHILHSLSERVHDLIPQNVLDIPITQWEGCEEHGVQHGCTGEEAVKREHCLSLSQAVGSKLLCLVAISGFHFQQSMHAMTEV